MSQIKDSSFESGKQQANKWSLALHSVQFPFSISSLPSSILIIQIIAARGKGNGWQANTHARMHAHTHVGDGLALRRTSPGRQRIFSLSEKSIGGGEEEKEEEGWRERIMMLSIKVATSFQTARFLRGHVKLLITLSVGSSWCHELRAEQWPPSRTADQFSLAVCRRGRAAEPSAGQTGFSRNYLVSCAAIVRKNWLIVDGFETHIRFLFSLSEKRIPPWG